ncbi:MAG: T9SS type A sorting domain-containing protein [Rhodothermaceae bacterium]|nr:T9SS type A sorting domain-containing protein [Rhodothermaceae bacterium]
MSFLPNTIRHTTTLPIYLFILVFCALAPASAWAQDALIRINSGTSTEATAEGETFIGDSFFFSSTVGPIISRNIAGTTNDDLYLSERLTNDDGDTLYYEIPVPENGTYSVNLHFAETAFDQIGLRVFDIVIEGNTAFDNYDIMEAAGDNNTAQVEEVTGIFVNDGFLTIELEAEVERAKINGIEVFGSAEEVQMPFLLNVGGQELASTTETWMEDEGTYFLEGQELTRSDPIAGTTADELYQSERFGNDVDPLRFLLTGVPSNVYDVELHFSENFVSNEGDRVFNAYVEGQAALTNYDILAAAGDQFTAQIETIEGVSVTDGILNITLEPLTGTTTLNAIAVTISPLSINNEDEIAVPSDYTLSAIYPNPFNPTTQFTLTMGQTQQVSIDVYNVLGQRVASLHEGILTGQSTHAFTFEATSQPSGLYLIQVTGEQFVETRQVVLMK